MYLHCTKFYLSATGKHFKYSNKIFCMVQIRLLDCARGFSKTKTKKPKEKRTNRPCLLDNSKSKYTGLVYYRNKVNCNTLIGLVKD